MKPVDSFVHAIRRRLNRIRTCRVLLWAITGGSLALLAAAAAYILRGYEVDRVWYAVAAAGTGIAAAAGMLCRRVSAAEASEYADRFFNLKDTIVSQRRFESEHETGGYYDLQAEQTRERVAVLDAAKVPFAWPRKLATCASVLALAAGLTAFKGTDLAILERQEQEDKTQGAMEELKKQFLNEVEELEKSTDDPEEKKALNADELRKFVKELEATKDLAEAMKQLAALERKMDKAAMALTDRKSEELLKKAGEELGKEEDPQARELAQKLKNEQFKAAAKDLEKMRDEQLSPELKKLSDQRKQAARMKAAAKRMAAAAKQQKSTGSKSPRDSKNNQSAQNSKSSQQSSNSKNQQNQNQLANSEDAENAGLDEDLEKLEMEADEYDADLEDLENLEKLGKIDPSKLEKCRLSKDKLGDRLKLIAGKCNKLGIKRSAKLKLASLCKKAGQCQGCLQGQCQSPFAMPGGLKPGDGTLENSRDAKDELTDNGQTTQLRGQKGNGPSLVKVEEAEDGSGVSHRKAEAKERAFKQQFESFVQREDVPEDVKEGVKNYFNSLHAAEAAPAAPAAAK